MARICLKMICFLSLAHFCTQKYTFRTIQRLWTMDKRKIFYSFMTLFHPNINFWHGFIWRKQGSTICLSASEIYTTKLTEVWWCMQAYTPPALCNGSMTRVGSRNYILVPHIRIFIYSTCTLFFFNVLLCTP